MGIYQEKHDTLPTSLTPLAEIDVTTIHQVNRVDIRVEKGAIRDGWGTHLSIQRRMGAIRSHPMVRMGNPVEAVGIRI